MDETPTREALAEAIEELGRRYLAEGRAASLHDINDGLCEDFAVAVADSLGGERDGFEGTWADNLTVDGAGAEWDVALLREAYPACVPTHGLSWDDVAFEIPRHYWLVLGGRHHDAECPEGVDNLFELPIVRRDMERIVAARAAAPGR